MPLDVDEILDEVLMAEGWPEYTEHPNDRGGPTKGGITLRALESWKGKPCTRRDLKLFTRKKAIKLLTQRYVHTHGINFLIGEKIGPQLVDNSVLSGPRLSVKDLQQVLGVPADGVIGPQTLAAYKKRPNIGNKLAITRSLRLARHVKKHPDQLVFLTGWLTRCLSFIE